MNGSIFNTDAIRRTAEIRAERAARDLERAIARLDQIDRMPVEPQPKDGDPNVIFFRKFSRSNKIYDYAAIQVADGTWYTTGPSSPKSYTWEQLMNWLFEDTGFEPVIYQARKFRPIS